MQATIAIVQFDNHNEVQRIINEVSLVTNESYEVIIIDNNTSNFQTSYVIPQLIKQFTLYRNYNIGMLAGAVNQAIAMAQGEYFVYLCGNHVHINSHDWLDYMIDCLGHRSMGGTVLPYIINGRGGTHVQGGCYIANTDILKTIQYDEILFPFTYMDVDISYRLLKEGYELVDIPLVRSIMGDLKDKESYKIYHSHK